LPVARRIVLKAGAAIVSTWTGPFTMAQSAESEGVGGPQSTVKTMTMAETPLGVTSKVTVERRDQIVLIGINRPSIHNRVDPEAYLGLAKAYYQYEHDASTSTPFRCWRRRGDPCSPTRKLLILCQRQKAYRSRWS
jgi:hypothetical protein